jgi:hypothetical protein
MGDQWYTNKELYEMVIGLKDDLQETRVLIQQYNGLRKRLDACDATLADLVSQAKGRATVGNAIRSWGGWIFGLISMILALLKAYGII